MCINRNDLGILRCHYLRSDLVDILSYSAAASLVAGFVEPVFPLANRLLKKLAKTVSFPPSPAWVTKWGGNTRDTHTSQLEDRVFVLTSVLTVAGFLTSAPFDCG